MIEASTEIVVGLDRRGHSVVQRMNCEAPMLVRVVGGSSPLLELAMVNGAAGPLGGDRLRFRLEVQEGAQVSVRSVAAAMAQPGPRGEPSHLNIDLLVGAGATLDWRPQPTVSVIGSDHRTTMRLESNGSATVTMREGVSLGRHAELPGRFTLRERVVIDGRAVLDHETTFATGALMGPGGQGAGRCMATEVVIGSSLPEPAAFVDGGCVRSTVHLSRVCALTVSRT